MVSNIKRMWSGGYSKDDTGYSWFDLDSKEWMAQEEVDKVLNKEQQKKLRKLE